MHPTSRIQGQRRLDRRICNHGQQHLLQPNRNIRNFTLNRPLPLHAHKIYQPATISLKLTGENGIDYKGNFTIIDSNI